MILYRLTGRRYANDLSGAGAARSGTRWTGPKVHVVYAAAAEASTLLRCWPMPWTYPATTC